MTNKNQRKPLNHLHIKNVSVLNMFKAWRTTQIDSSNLHDVPNNLHKDQMHNEHNEHL